MQIDIMSKQRIKADLQKNMIRQGFLLKRSKFLKEWRQRWVVLTYNFFITFTSKEKDQMTDVIDLSTVKNYKSYVAKNDDIIPAALKIRSGDNQIYLTAENTFEKWSWIVSFQRLMDLRVRGKSNFNCFNDLKQRGFPSYQEYVKKIEHQKAKQEVSAEEKQTLKVMKQLLRQKQVLQSEKSKVKKQKQHFQKQKHVIFEQIRNSLPMQNNRVSFQSLQQLRNSLNITSNPSTTTVSESSPKNIIISNMLNQFHVKGDSELTQYYITYIIDCFSNSKLKYKNPIMEQLKSHPNAQNFLQTVQEYLQICSQQQFQKLLVLIQNVLVEPGIASGQIFKLSCISKVKVQINTLKDVDSKYCQKLLSAWLICPKQFWDEEIRVSLKQIASKSKVQSIIQMANKLLN